MLEQGEYILTDRQDFDPIKEEDWYLLKKVKLPNIIINDLGYQYNLCYNKEASAIELSLSNFRDKVVVLIGKDAINDMLIDCCMGMYPLDQHPAMKTLMESLAKEVGERGGGTAIQESV
jgi:hypothetical protein